MTVLDPSGRQILDHGASSKGDPDRRTHPALAGREHLSHMTVPANLPWNLQYRIRRVSRTETAFGRLKLARLLNRGFVDDATNQPKASSRHWYVFAGRLSFVRSNATYLYNVVREIFKVAQMSSTLIDLSRKSFCARTTLGAFGFSGRQPPRRPRARAAARPASVRS